MFDAFRRVRYFEGVDVLKTDVFKRLHILKVDIFKRVDLLKRFNVFMIDEISE